MREFDKYAREVNFYNTMYASQNNLYKKRLRTNAGKQTISALNGNGPMATAAI